MCQVEQLVTSLAVGVVQNELLTVVIVMELHVVDALVSVHAPQLAVAVAVAELAAGVALVLALDCEEPSHAFQLPSPLALLGVTVGLPLMIVTVTVLVIGAVTVTGLPPKPHSAGQDVV